MDTDITSNERPETKKVEITCSGQVESSANGMRDDSNDSNTRTQITFMVLADQVSNTGAYKGGFSRSTSRQEMEHGWKVGYAKSITN